MIHFPVPTTHNKTPMSQPPSISPLAHCLCPANWLCLTFISSLFWLCSLKQPYWSVQDCKSALEGLVKERQTPVLSLCIPGAWSAWVGGSGLVPCHDKPVSGTGHDCWPSDGIHMAFHFTGNGVSLTNTPIWEAPDCVLHMQIYAEGIWNRPGSTDIIIGTALELWVWLRESHHLNNSHSSSSVTDSDWNMQLLMAPFTILFIHFTLWTGEQREETASPARTGCGRRPQYLIQPGSLGVCCCFGDEWCCGLGWRSGRGSGVMVKWYRKIRYTLLVHVRWKCVFCFYPPCWYTQTYTQTHIEEIDLFDHLKHNSTTEVDNAFKVIEDDTNKFDNYYLLRSS